MFQCPENMFSSIRTDIWPGIRLYAIAICVGWPTTCIKIRLKQVERDVMHQNVCTDDELKHYEMKNSNVSILMCT